MALALHKPIRITVCMDGFVSVTEDMKKRRLNAALVAHTVEDYATAMQLVAVTTRLQQCDHGKKTGITLEPRVIGWPKPEDATHHDAMWYGGWLQEEEARLRTIRVYKGMEA